MNIVRVPGLNAKSGSSVGRQAMTSRKSLVALLVCALVQSALLAGMSFVYCIGLQGHRAVETCAGPSCHGVHDGNAIASASEENGHDQPCIDRKVTDDVQASDPEVPSVAPVIVPVPAPLVAASAIPKKANVRLGAGFEHGLPSLCPARPLVLRI